MRDKYTDAIRIGIVSSIDPDKGTAQVTFEDRDGIVSRDLHLNFMKTLEDYYYCMPDIGERVRVFFDPEAPSRGYILGSFPSDTREPPIKDKDKTYVLFKDKTLIEYDRDLHKLTITIPATPQGDLSIDIFTESNIDTETNGEINTKAAKDISEKSDKNINITADMNINIKAAAVINIESGAEMNLTAGGDMTLKAPNIHLNP